MIAVLSHFVSIVYIHFGDPYLVNYNTMMITKIDKKKLEP